MLDDGVTWRQASIHPTGGGAYRVTLPRVDARDTAGNRVEQTLYDAYTS